MRHSFLSWHCATLILQSVNTFKGKHILLVSKLSSVAATIQLNATLAHHTAVLRKKLQRLLDNLLDTVTMTVSIAVKVQ